MESPVIFSSRVLQQNLQNSSAPALDVLRQPEVTVSRIGRREAFSRGRTHLPKDDDHGEEESYEEGRQRKEDGI
jgi:hypothetical protein